MWRKPAQKLAVNLSIMCHAQRFASVPFLIHRHKDGEFLVSVSSDKMFHTAAAPPCARGFARSLAEAPLQRFHSIIIGPYFCRPTAGASPAVVHMAGPNG